jgi:hypothetical protein
MSNLITYKNSKINELTNAFNSDVNTLRTQLNNNINYIIKLRINNRIKSIYVNMYISNFNTSVNNLRIKLNSNIKIINSLTSIPGSRNAGKFLLSVGINYKNTSNELYGCINDANNIKTLLFQKYGFTNSVLLTDDTNKKPTKENIINEFTNLLVNSISGDSLFFFYSGHGTNTTDLNRDELDGQDELLVPIDAVSIQTCIIDDQLNSIIKTNLKPGVKLFTMFDSCFSGTVLDLKYNYIDSQNLDKLTVNPNVSDTVSQVFMISGCSDNQTSEDAVISDGTTQSNSGAMTFAFLNTIEQTNSPITFKSLLQTMRTLLSDNGFTQIPQLSSGILTDINTQLVAF